MSARWLVTGASGFVGGRLCEALVDAGHETRALVFRTPLTASESVTSRLDVVRGDVRRPEDCARACDGVDFVIHCAALLDPVPSEREADEVNHLATATLADAAREAGCRAFVYVSSQAAIGWREDAGLVDEAAPCAPSTAYGRSKRAGELAALARASEALRVSVLRPPTVYGPGEARNFRALSDAVATGVFPVIGDGKNRMSFCHVDNLVEAIRFVASDGGARGILHVADEPVLTLARVVDALARASGTRRLPLRVPLPIARAGAALLERAFAPFGRRGPLDRARLRTLTSDCALDTGALRRLGFVPPIAFEDGAREVALRFREGAPR
ncbi:MAG: NAD-dependent epimerase/dehydratase family protein [Sandaracinaceae bacterium]